MHTGFAERCSHTVATCSLQYVCMFVYLCVCVSMQGVGVGGCLQIVLGPVDPSQSEWSCLSLSALDSRGTLIRPDSQPQEMMGRETAHSNHVTRCAETGGQAGGCGVGVLDGMEKQEGSEVVCSRSSRGRNRSLAWHHNDKTHNALARTHTHTCTDKSHTDVHRQTRTRWNSVQAATAVIFYAVARQQNESQHACLSTFRIVLLSLTPHASAAPTKHSHRHTQTHTHRWVQSEYGTDRESSLHIKVI